jgi:trigger factor
MAHVHNHDSITVTATGTEGLTHKFSISIPADAIEDHVKEHLISYGKTAKIQGFRPGKIPMAVLQQKFRGAVMGEVLEHMADAGVHKALNDNKLKPAMQPKVEFESYKEGEALNLKVECEVLPPLPAIDYSKIKLEKPVAKPTDAQIDEAVKNLADSTGKTEPVADGTAAQMGNVVTIDFVGTVDGIAKPGMAGTDMPVTLGKRQLIDTFEDQMVGMKMGDEKLIKVTFPAEYHAADLAGKPAEFQVTIKSVAAKVAPELNDEFAKQFGIDDLKTLREKLGERLQDELNAGARLVMKRKLLDHLSEKYAFDLPQGMLDAEFNAIWQRVTAELKDGKDETGKTEAELKPEYQNIAARRVRLGLLLADLAEKENIEVGQDELRQSLFAEIQRYPQQGKEVLDYYTKTPGAMDTLRAPLLEEKAVDFLFGKATVTEKIVTKEDLEKQVEELTG